MSAKSSLRKNHYSSFENSTRFILIRHFARESNFSYDQKNQTEFVSSLMQYELVSLSPIFFVTYFKIEQYIILYLKKLQFKVGCSFALYHMKKKSKDISLKCSSPKNCLSAKICFLLPAGCLFLPKLPSPKFCCRQRQRR